MPYELKCSGAECNVHKKGDPNPKNKKPMSKDRATKYMAALYANTEGGKKDLSDLEYAVIEEKCYSENYAPYVEKVSARDANYDPLGGRTGDRACANCRWFNVGADSCYVVQGPIVPTGLSDMWMEMPPPWKPEPMPVVIVDNVESDAESLGSKTGSDATRLNAVAEQINKTVQSYPLNAGRKSAEPDQADSGFKVLDNGRWIGWWTNNARDRADEQFTLNSIDGFIARVDSKRVPYPELWHKHLHIPMGRADSLARIGYLGFATGTFYDTPTGQSGRKAYEKDQAAGIAKKMSHQFLYPKSMKRDGVIHAFNSFELSVLDAGEEANPITNFGVKAMKVVLDAKKRAELLDKFGNDDAYVNKLLDFADVVSKQMEAAGLDLKSLESLPELMDFEVRDQAAHDAVNELGAATLAGIKSLTESIKELNAKAETDRKGLEAALEQSNKAVSDLKAFVEKEFGYTPRASKSDLTKIAKTDSQVQHLKKQNVAAGKKTAEDATPEGAAGGQKSIFDEIVAAAKNGRG